jgi:hypothetical protein
MAIAMVLTRGIHFDYNVTLNLYFLMLLVSSYKKYFSIAKSKMQLYM